MWTLQSLNNASYQLYIFCITFPGAIYLFIFNVNKMHIFQVWLVQYGLFSKYPHPFG